MKETKIKIGTRSALKIKIGTRSIQQSQLEYDVRNAIEFINGPLREGIYNLGFTPSEELFKDCVDGGRVIAQDYYARLTKELNIMTSPSSRKIFEKAGQESIKQFNAIRELVMNKCGTTVQKYITFDGEIAVFSDESQKQLSEDMGIYITDPEEIELYNLHVDACKALNNLFQGHISPEWYKLFDVGNKRFIPESRTLYSILLSNIKRANENGK